MKNGFYLLIKNILSVALFGGKNIKKFLRLIFYHETVFNEEINVQILLL